MAHTNRKTGLAAALASILPASSSSVATDSSPSVVTQVTDSASEGDPAPASTQASSEGDPAPASTQASSEGDPAPDSTQASSDATMPENTNLSGTEQLLSRIENLAIQVSTANNQVQTERTAAAETKAELSKVKLELEVANSLVTALRGPTEQLAGVMRLRLGSEPKDYSAGTTQALLEDVTALTAQVDKQYPAGQQAAETSQQATRSPSGGGSNFPISTPKTRKGV